MCSVGSPLPGQMAVLKHQTCMDSSHENSA